MYLKSLEINGFKSFGKKSQLDFKTPITAIVGPNGSGKSNVAEAFRFVLGEQSLKSMRGKRGEDMIFNGSTDAGRANRAGVKLVFDNSKKLLNVDFDEVTLERVVFRDGANEYYINGSKVRLKDIIELLAQAHIGSSGHHIISQGEADRILHSNPKERREMIEDALGIKVYQYKKEESERKLEKTEENIKQVESLRREIAPHLKFLKKQVEKLEKAREIKDELVSLAKEYFKREEAYVHKKKSEVSDAKRAPETELAELDGKLLEARRLVEAGLKDKEVSPEILTIETKLSEARSRKDDLMRDAGRLEGELSYLAKAIEREEKTLSEAGNKLVPLWEVETLVNDSKIAIEEAERTPSVESLRGAFQKVREMFSKFVSKHRQASSTGVIDSLREEMRELEAKKRDFDEALLKAKKDQEHLLSDYESKRKEFEKAKDDTREAEKEIFKVIARQNEVRAHLDKVKVEERQALLDEETLKTDMSEVSALAGFEALHFNDLAIDTGYEERHLQHDRKKHVERLKIRLEEMGVSGGDDVLKEHNETEERDAFLARELVDLEQASIDLRALIKELEEKLNQEFRDGVAKINASFGSYFSSMFGGGHASLKLIKPERKKKPEDEDDVSEDEEQEEGIEIEVSLPHKKIKGLMMLSGGERALTSIALLFAISQVNPPPFVILDETDAALDEANSRKYGDMIENLAEHSQLIVITHNRETMSRAGILYGVTMGKDAVSKLLSISFSEAEVVAK
ncbi:MAG: AAA family ATPase [Candidatus Paceibacterota bacterium]|jgi:chromosome segregation protein